QYQAAEFTVQQKILALTATYIIKDVFGREFMRARKSMLSMFRPYIEVKNAFGQMLGYIQGNFWRTEWKFYDVSGILHGQVVFPFFMFFRKTFTLYTNFGVFHSGQSIFAKRFDCFDPNGQLTFVVDKQIFTIRDQFKIITNGILSPFITTMAAVCIDMKLFQGNKSRNLFQFL
ncbi:MAG: hypothetical protein OEY49_18730, partial [Candidatus Heimdallarchaeota archaeon]|nr:hypothetical protein [Candidatus Heimdallarchaeota archaeon]